jgi:hypothetical protein
MNGLDVPEDILPCCHFFLAKGADWLSRVSIGCDKFFELVTKDVIFCFVTNFRPEMSICAWLGFQVQSNTGITQRGATLKLAHFIIVNIFSFARK